MKPIVAWSALALLAAALTAVLIAWHADVSHWRAASKKAAHLPQVLQSEQTADATLEQQHAQDVASMAQLRHDLNQATGQVKDLTAQLGNATASLANQTRDFTALSTQFNDLRDRDANLSSEETRYFELYTESNQALLDQREYIRGLYVDDLALRQAAKEQPYTTVVSLTAPPDAAAPHTKTAKTAKLISAARPPATSPSASAQQAIMDAPP